LAATCSFGPTAGSTGILPIALIAFAILLVDVIVAVHIIVLIAVVELVELVACLLGDGGGVFCALGSGLPRIVGEPGYTFTGRRDVFAGNCRRRGQPRHSGEAGFDPRAALDHGGTVLAGASGQGLASCWVRRALCRVRRMPFAGLSRLDAARGGPAHIGQVFQELVAMLRETLTDTRRSGIREVLVTRLYRPAALCKRSIVAGGERLQSGARLALLRSLVGFGLTSQGQ
jgi:hypothetical protein